MSKELLQLFFLSSVVLLFSCSSHEPLIGELGENQIASPSNSHFRGIQALSENQVWLSGTAGAVFTTTDGGQSWKDVSVPKCDSLDFRDIHAVDDKKAWVISSGNGVRIYQTTNGGTKWKLQFEDTNPKVFFDGIDFSDELNGVAYGDPINGSMDVLITSDGGENWNRVPAEKIPTAWEDEAGFAASGTGIIYKGSTIWMATGGGEISRVIKSIDKGKTWNVHMTPIIGGNGAGIFSMAFKDDLLGVVVGGDYVDSTRVNHNCAYTLDGGVSWSLVESNGPKGYRSCVTIMDSGTAVACGRTGIDKSSDFKTWESVSEEGYFTCDAVGEYVWFAGRSGKVTRLRVD